MIYDDDVITLQELKPHRNRGKPKTAEHRAKISDSQRKRHAARKQELQAVHPGALESSAPPVPEQTEQLSLPADLKPEVQEASSSDGERLSLELCTAGLLFASVAWSCTASRTPWQGKARCASWTPCRPAYAVAPVLQQHYILAYCQRLCNLSENTASAATACSRSLTV